MKFQNKGNDGKIEKGFFFSEKFNVDKFTYFPI